VISEEKPVAKLATPKKKVWPLSVGILIGYLIRDITGHNKDRLIVSMWEKLKQLEGRGA
jgi:hypothetical protein